MCHLRFGFIVTWARIITKRIWSRQTSITANHLFRFLFTAFQIAICYTSQRSLMLSLQPSLMKERSWPYMTLTLFTEARRHWTTQNCPAYCICQIEGFENWQITADGLISCHSVAGQTKHVFCYVESHYWRAITLLQPSLSAAKYHRMPAVKPTVYSFWFSGFRLKAFCT